MGSCAQISCGSIYQQFEKTGTSQTRAPYPLDMHRRITWIYFVSAQGREVVAQEIRKMKLSVREQESLALVLRRISHGSSVLGDIRYLGRDMWEVRIRLNHRILRLLYFVEMDYSAHIVVVAAIKKTQKTPPGWIDLALERKKTWQSIDSYPE